MAFQKTITTPHGFIAADAYHRVENLSIQGKDSISFLLCSKKSANDPAFAQRPFACDYDIDGTNPIKQAYTHLKTLPEFADATDC
jgi:hypothetical protein